MDYDFDPFQEGTNAARISNVAALDSDPEQAARSIELGDSAGVPPSAIYGDVDGFERQHKAALGGDIIANNLHIADYLNSHPLAPRLSHDDLGNLDNASGSISAIKDKGFGQQAMDWLKSDTIARGIAHGFGDQPLGSQFVQEPFKPTGNPLLDSWYKFSEGTARAGTMVPELALRSLNAVIFGASYGFLGEEGGEKAGQMLLDPGLQATLHGLGPPGAVAEGLQAALRAAAPWLRAGKEVPTGLHPELDKIKVDQAKADGDAISDALKDSVKTATRERSPEFYANFVRSHVGDREIGISADAVRDLYGDKSPTSDDNLLGWVPGIEDKLSAAEASGGDVRVPLADWLAKVDPEVADQLHDHLRVRLDGLTIDEGKVLAEQKAEVPEATGEEAGPKAEPGPISEPLPLVRGSAGLEPLFSIGDRKLELQKREHNEQIDMGSGVVFNGKEVIPDHYNLHNERGEPVGYLDAIPLEGGKKVFVANIGALEDKGYAANSFGPALTRDIARQIKTLYPDAEQIGGYRISGAREKAGTERQVWTKFDDALGPKGWQFASDLHGIMNEQRIDMGHSVLHYSEELQPHTAALDSAIRDELARILPKGLGKVFTPDALTVPGKPNVNRMGFMKPNERENPWIVVGLESPDAVGIARHEAVHFLKDYGFFQGNEWAQLSRTARDQDWFKRYDIDKRYPSLDPARKMDEAIAEGYRDWANGKEVPAALHPIFQRLKDFFDGLREKVKAILGHEPSWEEIFQKVHSGEVGGRDAAGHKAGAFFDPKMADEDKPETIVGPAAQFNREIHQGITHPVAAEKALKTVGKTLDDVDKVEGLNAEGFLTSKGRYVDREEAYKIAVSSEQFNAEGVKHMKGRTALDAGDLGMAAHLKDVERRNTKFADEPIPDIGGKEAESLRERIGKLSGELSVDKAHGKDIESDPRSAELKEAREQLRSITSGTFGMTVDQYTRYQKLIQRRHAEDLEAAQKSAEAYQKKTQTKEWKANRVEMRDQVREELEQRPDIAVDQMMAQEKLKFHPDHLTREQQAALPKEYVQKKNGVDPDDAAGYFGYHSGDAMVDRLALITADRKAAGMNAREWLNHMIDTETDRRMEAEHGDLNQRILDEAKDQAISETQLNLLHEEVLHLGLMAKSEFPISKSQLRAWNKEIFDKTPIASISTNEYLRSAGKAGKAAEMSLLKEDFADAFREKQKQNNAMIMANYAKAYEKARKSFDRTAKTFQKREVPSVPQEWTNWIHDILQRTGNRVNRSVQDLAENIGRQSEKTLQSFVEAKEAETFGLRETPIADFLLDPAFRSDMSKLTADEFYGLKQSLDVLAKQGRDEKKIVAAGEAADRDVVLREMRAKLGTFPTKPLPDERGAISKAFDRPRMFMAGMTNIETLMNRWDRADPRGIFNRYISYPMAKASNYKSSLEREYAKAYGSLGEIKDGGKFVDAPFADPLSRTEADPEGRAWPGFTRKHVLAMLQNAGNKGNWRVLARGYSTDPEALMNWLHRNTTKEDWDRAQKMGDDVFHSLVDKADTVYENLTGATIEKIPLEPVETPFGTYAGWYHPLIADPLRKEVWVKDPENGTWSRNATGRRGSVMDDSDYFHASTANGYTKRRTGAVYPLDLNFDVVPSRIKQMIHDIAFRDTIIQTEKIFGNKAFQAEVTKHYGPIYTDLLMPYLKSMAGAESIPSKAGAEAARVSEYLRQNVISTYIGLNPFTALKHGPTAAVMSSREVGPINFANAVKSLYGTSPELGLSNSEFALKHSEELQRRERHWQDTIAGQHNEIEGASTLREKIIEKGSWLVAQSDMLSAKPTWVAAYNDAIASGLSHGESVDLGDRAVRNAHGSTAQTNQPALVRGGGPLHGWLTSVYGFFGTAMQRRIEIAHQMNDAYQLGKEGEIKAAAKRIPGITADIMTYVVWPTLVEEWVTGLNQDDRRGWGQRAISGATMGVASSVLYLRDLVHAFTTGQDPGAGLLSSPLHDLANTVRDLRKGGAAFNRQHAGKTIGDMLTVFGEGTGMAPKVIGNAARFGIDLVNKQQHPRDISEYLRGATRGVAKKRVEK